MRSVNYKGKCIKKKLKKTEIYPSFMTIYSSLLPREWIATQILKKLPSTFTCKTFVKVNSQQILYA